MADLKRRSIGVLLVTAVLAIGAIGAVIQGPGQAGETSSSVGFVDVARLWDGYDRVAEAEAVFISAYQAADEEFAAKQADESASQEELAALGNRLDAELRQLSDQLNQDIERSFSAGIEKVAGTLGLDLVLMKDVVLAGGMDITDLVLDELNQ